MVKVGLLGIPGPVKFNHGLFSGKLIQMLNNPTLVVVTDRNDLDNQLYSTFVKSKDVLVRDY